jgi:saccharopine dehydrogenase-like NADP-dependent oxidoreductase
LFSLDQSWLCFPWILFSFLTRKCIACRTIETANKLSEGVKLATPVSLDVNNEQALDAAVAKHDLVVSLIPYTFHAVVIKSAIRNKKHVVTTSYVSPAMMELDAEAKAAGITVMNEIGLDPVSTPMHRELSSKVQTHHTRDCA